MITLFGALALLLFGVRFLGKGLDRLFGRRLGVWLGRVTGSRGSAFLAGLATTALAPSSTAISVLLVELVNRGRVEARRLVAVMLGANIGLTVVVHLLAVRIHDYALLFVAVGFAGFQFLRQPVLRGAGQVLLGFGLIFLAMGLIGQVVATAGPDAHELLAVLQGYPWLILLAATLLTVGFQTSTGVIGLVLAVVLSQPELLAAPSLLAAVLGANLGIGVTMLIAGWSDLDSRRLAVANLLPKLVVAVVLMLVLAPAGLVLGFLPGAPGRQVALAHTVFNLLVAAAFLPLSGLLWRSASWLVVGRASDPTLSAPQTHLSEAQLTNPALALASAHRETLLQVDEVRDMLARSWQAMQTGDVALAKRLRRQDDRIDARYLALKRFLTRIEVDDFDPVDHHWCTALLHFGNELESIGDLLDKDLLDLVVGHADDRRLLPAEEIAGLDQLYRQTRDRFEVATSALASRDPKLFAHLLESKPAIKELCCRMQEAHHHRLRREGAEALRASAYYLDLVMCLQRLNRHLNALGQHFGARSGSERLPGVFDGVIR